MSWAVWRGAHCGAGCAGAWVAACGRCGALRRPEELEVALVRFGPAALAALVGELGLGVPEAAAVSLRWGLAGLRTVERFHPEELEAVLAFATAGMEPWHLARREGHQEEGEVRA